MQQNFAQLSEQITQSYQLTPEEREELETDTVNAVPKLLAKVHVQTVMSAMHNIAQFVPRMIAQGIQQERQRSSNLNTFYKTWPSLDRANAQHREALNRIGAAYRAANPQATREQAIQDIGLMAMHQLGLQAAPRPNGGIQPRPAPFVPAGASPAVPSPAPEIDKWAGLGMDFED